MALSNAAWREAPGARAIKERAADIYARAFATLSFAPGGRAVLVAGALVAGISFYLGLSREPAPVFSAVAALSGAGLFAASWRRGRDDGAGFALLLLAAALIGFARADLRVEQVDAPRVPAYERARSYSGWVERIDPGDRGRRRYVLRVSEAEGLDPQDTPYRVRISARAGAAHLGEAVRMRAVLRPPPGPSAPGGYDFARSAFFARLGGVGYAIADVEPAPEVRAGGMARALARLRGALAQRLRHSAGERAGPIVAALVSGDRSEISSADAEALRAAGLGHVLAISGLHMALFAGGVFFGLSLLLARWDWLARRCNVRKIAAIGGLAAAIAYLAISGAGVSAQRAFIMTSIALIAVIADRRALSMRGVAAAAVLVLLVAPESALTPGFQMSFAAAAALVATNDILRRRRSARSVQVTEHAGLIGKARNFAQGVALTSFVAGSATSPFAAYHFNRLAPYGFLANLAAMPVFSLIVMPFAALAGVLAPFGLDAPFARIAGWGVEFILWISYATQSVDGSLAPVSAAPPLAAALAALALIAGCALNEGRGRIAGLLAFAAFATWSARAPGELWIGSGGSVAVLSEDADGVRQAHVALNRGDRYGAELFARRNGVDLITEGLSRLDAFWRCDAHGCAGVIGGRRIVMADTLAMLSEDCARADIVIINARAPPRLAARCGAELIEAGGAARVMRFGPPGPETIFADAATRPWTSR